MRRILISAVVVYLFSLMPSSAQVTFPVNGLPDERKVTYAFTNVTLWIDHQTRVDSATLVIRDGRVTDAGKNAVIPKGAVVHDMTGKWIYPSFIDAFTSYGMPDRPKQERGRGPVITSATRGAYSWNQALKPEVQGHRLFTVNNQDASRYRQSGFGVVMTAPNDGIARGTGSVVRLAEGEEHELIMLDRAVAAYSFNKGSSPQDYPTSEMGAIALLRQSFLDAEWYAAGGKNKEYNISIESWNANRPLPQFFEADNYLQSLRVDKIGDEFGVRYVVVGSGDEYKRITEIKQTGNAFVIPLKFPEGFDVSDPYDAMNMTLGELRHWETAPANPFLLYNAGVEFALTAHRLKDPSEFLGQLRTAVHYGLPPQAALKAVTETPAKLLGISSQAGNLQKGKLANFIVTSGDIFKKETVIHENWIGDKRYEIRGIDPVVRSGSYQLKAGTAPEMRLLIFSDTGRVETKVIHMKDTVRARSSYENNVFSLRFELKKGEHKGTYSLTGYRTADAVVTFRGDGFDPSANRISWQAVLSGEYAGEAKQDTSKVEVPQWSSIRFPNKAYGFDSLPAKENILFRNVTVWTNEKEGIMSNADVLIVNGKISRVGKNLDPKGARVIDGTGKHLTPGIIDEHSHIAVSNNVNECSHAITSEVRIGDVIDPDDINIYRQLSGGVTSAQLLHGSCNPVGGQSAIIKLRWGMPAEKMKFEGAPGFIKFALGENVKQANWGDDFKIRYPQTRMGVEQVYVDAFTRAKEYEAEWKAYNPKQQGSVKPRRDLRLETILEIHQKKRHITCHSYQQGEINMLMKVADSLGFKVNTFTHILEGYKVADKMKAHGAGASSFSDWWAYKYEVIEAIPHNGPILHRAGVTVAYNSDDAEMARRLNQEAAKAVMYGGLSEEEAFKFVTLNPAKLLRIDDRVGSIREGKDADVVLWNGNPLSVYSKALMTFIDGACYFDSERDAQMRKTIEADRARIIKKMMDEKGKAGQGDQKKPPFNVQHLHHCMDHEEEL